MSATDTLVVHAPQFKGSVLSCSYTIGSEDFENTYQFPNLPELKNSKEFEKLCQWLAVVTSLGLFSVDYFEKIRVDFELSQQEVEFFEKLIFLGLGEFKYINKIPINTRTKILGEHKIYQATSTNDPASGPLKPLLLNGGGKDGSVSAYLLKEAGIDFTWFSRGDTVAQRKVAEVWDAPVISIIRELDSKRENRKYAGHRPMSAGIAFLAVLSAHIYGYDSVIASNELSANEGNFVLDGFSINHQYSKSLEFEEDLQNLIKLFGIKERYFSLLRPLHELQIAVIATNLSDKQLKAITSCNHGTKDGTWCMKCAKCAFVVLVITAASPLAAEKIWGDKQAINSPGLLPYLIELLDPDADKPFECVGTLDECQLAAYIIVQNRDIPLSPEVGDVLNRFASKKKLSMVHELGDSVIPDEYQHIKEQMNKHLGEWQKRAVRDKLL